MEDGYVQGFVLIDKLLELKLRFLAAHAERFPDAQSSRAWPSAGGVANC